MIYSDLKDDINAFLSKNAIWLAVVLVAVIILVIFLFIFLNMKKKGKFNHKNNNISNNADEWQIAVGGKNNIQEITAMGSRLTLSLNDPNVVDREKLKQLGVSNILTMSEKIILVVEDNAGKVKERLSK